jgi:hypothetical protein
MASLIETENGSISILLLMRLPESGCEVCKKHKNASSDAAESDHDRQPMTHDCD